MLNRLLAVTATLVALVALGACGQKGPLYLPGTPTEIRSEVPTTNSPAEIEEEDSERRKKDQPPQ